MDWVYYSARSRWFCRLRSELRERIRAATDNEWRRRCAEVRRLADPIAGFERLDREDGEKLRSAIDYDNKQLANELIPAYRRMLAIFRDNMWLAEPQTRQYYGALLEFNEIWERWLANIIPYYVVEALEHSEARLHPFYEHLDRKHDELRERLRQA